MSKSKQKPSLLSRFIEIPIDKLVKADWNYKQNDEALRLKLRENLKRNGQIENIVVRELPTGFYEIVNGNHRYDELLEIGEPSVVCFNLGAISQASAIRIAIETNETRFATDHIKLAERIQELSLEFGIGDLTSTMPFSQEELDNMGKMLDYDWGQFAKPPEQGDEDGDSDEEEPIRIEIPVSSETLGKWQIVSSRLKNSGECETDEDVIIALIKLAEAT